MENLGRIRSMVSQSARQVTEPGALVIHLELLRDILTRASIDAQRAETSLEVFFAALAEAIESPEFLEAQISDESLENQWRLYSCWLGEAFLSTLKKLA